MSKTPTLSALQMVQMNSLPSLVQAEIEQMILRGELGVSQRINESDLATRFGISRGPVREGAARWRNAAWCAPRKTAACSCARSRWPMPTKSTTCAKPWTS
ncbi:GntR family transcriptional regulator [Polaromonas sp. P1(28)-13]|nr:GntR family transcriptional regulator [Polaromonas sp. P1(28)-13]